MAVLPLLHGCLCAQVITSAASLFSRASNAFH